MESKHNPRLTRKKERMRQAWMMRLKGHSVTDIARTLGAGISTISQDLSAMHAEWVRQHQEDAAKAAEKDLARLDLLLCAIMDQALAGDNKSVQTALKILEQRARMLGLHKPTQLEITDTPTSKEALQQMLLERLKEGNIA